MPMREGAQKQILIRNSRVDMVIVASSICETADVEKNAMSIPRKLTTTV